MSSQPGAATLAAIGEGLVELSIDGAGTPRLGYGGDVANICVMAGRAGARVRLIGRTGADGLGRVLRDFWSEAGIDLRDLRSDPGAATGLYLNEEADGGHRFVYLRSGSAGSRLEPDDLASASFADVGFLAVTGITLAISASAAAAADRAVELARAAGARIACVLNHRPALGGDVGRLADLARRCDVLIGSTEDTRSVFAGTDVRDLPTEPAEVVLTDGGAPAQLVEDGVVWRQDVPAVPVRNAAGAGDAMAGTYLAGRLAGRSAPEALRLGVAAASLSVQRDGCAESYPDLGDIERFAASMDGPNR